MKSLPILVFLFLAASCHSQGQTPPEAAVAKVPATTLGLKEIHWQLRDVLRMQLPATHPDERNGQHFKKNYSLDYRWEEPAQGYLIELPEKRLDVESEQISGGSKYFIPFQNVDADGVRLRVSEDEKRVALVIPAKEGQSFTYHPYGNEPDEQVSEVVIGWYDRVQDHTLGRALVLWQQFFEKMKEGK